MFLALIGLSFSIGENANAEGSTSLAERGYKCEEPYYPAAALRSGTTGRTMLRITTDEAGHIAEVVTVRSSGKAKENRLLDLSAVQHVKTCKQTLGKASGVETFTYELVWKLPSTAD